MPWPFGIAAGLVAFAAFRYAIPWWIARQDSALANGLGGQFWQALAPLAWMLLAICWLAALLSYLGQADVIN